MGQPEDKQKRESEEQSEEETYFYFEIRNKNHIKNFKIYCLQGGNKRENKDYRRTKMKLEKYPEWKIFKIKGEEKKVPMIARFFQDFSIQSNIAEGYWKVFCIKEEGKIWSKIDENGNYKGPIMKKYIESENMIPTEPPFRMKNPYWDVQEGMWKERG